MSVSAMDVASHGTGVLKSHSQFKALKVDM